ncbi:hypothetical protein [Rhodocaloribacter litoris]|uniref:hypothetical protein n=1 Tax=Rhodocaloribacter litoris TaxID=2558931 RepID=UPI001E5B7B07|nr:hypothetical protein [Rhodocaloribacter litoris]
MPYPAFVELCEVGPRDGFQFEEKPIPTDLKVAIIEGLVAAGLRRIQVTSFVHPKWVPQMADAEEVVTSPVLMVWGAAEPTRAKKGSTPQGAPFMMGFGVDLT